MYLTYLEYTKYGGALSEAAFSELEFEARTRIDFYTFGRLKKDEVFTENVKRAVYKIIGLLDVFGKYQTIVTDVEHPIMASASNDGVSETFGGYLGNTSPQDVDTVSKKLDLDIADTIKLYLSDERNQAGQMLLYRGVY